MIGKLILLGLCAAAFAQESSVDTKTDLETLKSLTAAGEKRVQETVELIKGSPKEFMNLTAERVECLIWEVSVQQGEKNKSVAEAISKGMQKNKQFNNFQCISKASQETTNKLEAIEDQIIPSSDKIRDKGLSAVRAFELIMPGFSSYCTELKKQKSDELIKANNQEARNKVLKEVGDKMKLLDSILKQVDDMIATTKYKFLEEHINFAHQLENNVRKVQREGSQKILKCVN